MRYEPQIKNFADPPRVRSDWRNGVVVRSTNWLGDALMTLPAAYQLSRLKPSQCGFFVLCPKNLAALWRACPWVDVVVEMEGKRISREECHQIRKLDAGIGVVFPNSFGSALDLFKCRIPCRVGRRGRFRRWLLTNSLHEWKRVGGVAQFHQLSFYFDLVSSLGEIDCTTEYPALKTDASLANALGVNGEGWLALAPGAAYGPAKQWPAEHFLAVAKWHVANGGRVVLVGTKKEQEVTAWIAAQVEGALDLAGRTSLDELMAVLAVSRKVVANDSGAMHLAAAVGTSGVAVFGSTDPIGTGPIGAPWRIVVSNEGCRPCFKRVCPAGDYRCLYDISPEEVIAELEIRN